MRRTAEGLEVGPADGGSAGLRAHTLAFARKHLLILCLIGCYLVFGFFASLFIPPWQSPDEPAHFEHAMLTSFGTNAELPQVQQPILQTFETFRFYELRRLPTPDHRPSSFSAISWAIIRQVGKTPLYYQLAWLAASWTNDTILQLYSMRWLSVVLSALTIPLVYALVREVLPQRPMMALLGAAFVALLPMYGYIGASVNPDVIGAPVAAFSVLFSVRALNNRRAAASLALAVTTAVLAVFVRRSSVALVPWVGLVVVCVVLPLLWQRFSKAAVLVGSGMLLVICTLALIWPSRLAADWYPDLQTRTSLTDQAFEGRSAFSLTAHADGSPSAVSFQIPRYQVATLRGNQIKIQAEVRGDAPQAVGSITLTSEKSVVSSLPLNAPQDWHTVELQADIPDDIQTLFITLSGNSVATTTFDAIHASRLPDGEPVLVSNSGAEDAYTWWQARFLSQTFVDYTVRIIQAIRLGTYTSPQAWSLYPWYLDNLSASFIGRFGWMAIGLPVWMENALRLIGAVLLAGIALAWRHRTAAPTYRRVLLLLVLLVLGGITTLLLEYTQYLALATFPQGRYLFPFLGPIATLLICGLAQWLPPRFDRVTAVLGTSALLVFHLWCWFGLIIPYFYE